MTDALPMAVGIALSPFPIIPAIMLLFTGRPKPTAAGFLLGWMLGVAALVVAGVLLADLVEAFEAPGNVISWVRLVLGILLIGYGAKLGLNRGKRAEPPAWMRSLQQATPGRAVRLGALLSAANPKVALLALTGGLAIGTGAGSQLGPTVIFVAVASATVAAPLVAYLVWGERALRPLGRAREWLERNNDAVMAIVLVLIGVLVIVNGWQGISGQ